MGRTLEDRIAALERRTEEVEAWVGIAEARTAAAAVQRPAEPEPEPRLFAPRVASPPRAPRRAVPAAAPVRPRVALEDALGGQVLAWVGGAAVALGVIFLLAIGVSSGWLGEVERTLLAALVSSALLASGAWAHGRRGRTDAAKAAVAAGIVGLFATCIVATAMYAIVPVAAALAVAVAVGAIATSLAVRWDAPGIAALGVLGALASPVMVGAVGADAPVLLLLVATASAAGVLLWQRWTWLALGAFVIATPQWIAYLVIAEPPAAFALAVLIAFGALTAAGAVGFEIRARAVDVRVLSILLLAINALLLGVVGVDVLGAGASAWLVGLAAAHLGAGLAARRSARVSPELTLAALVLGVVLVDVAAVRLLDGLPLVAGWAAGGALFAALVRQAAPGADQRAALAGLGSHMLLALSHALLDAPPGAIGGAAPALAGQVALAVVAAGCLVSGRLAADGRTTLRALLDAGALAILAYQTAITLDGVAFTVALAAEAIALSMIARRHRDDEVARGGALVFAAAATLHALAVLAPPDALVNGLSAPLAAAAGLGAVAIAVAFAALAVPERAAELRGAAAVIVLYAASVLLVTPFEPQQGQALLSALWALAGVGVLVAGLVRDDAALRRAALVLLALTVGKVFVFDLASLTSLNRVVSFIALGLLLLAGAFAWQRIRPRPLPDLRTVPTGLR